MKQLFLITGCAVLFACNTGVEVDFDPEVDFSAYKTFEICEDDLVPQATNQALYDNVENRKIVYAKLKEGLEAMGLLSSKESPDLFVNFYVQVEQHMEQVSSCTPDERLNYWTNCTLKDVYYEEGTLTVRLTDNAKKQVVWQGWASGILNNESYDADAVIGKSVDKILANITR